MLTLGLSLTFTAGDAAFCAWQKMDQKQTLSERSEFRLFPIFCHAQNVMALASSPEGQVCGRLSLLTFFGEAKKVSGRRATPGQQSQKPDDRKR
ncbi:hypothetical protein [Undibacterium sp.]|jgi:hypothetical protein|uniref:hypothetical protein n=1 Tax=Undibacterium sp. TaxID=1914977 RepID=UPI002BD57E95|nr:hypothetical protein [Undibacterium sp.]HTD05466.1 hypothetical protein [Undibacterium sp.]